MVAMRIMIMKMIISKLNFEKYLLISLLKILVFKMLKISLRIEQLKLFITQFFSSTDPNLTELNLN